jgi:hypothetical protein
MRFEDTAGIDAFRHLRQLLPRDLPNWARNDGLEPTAPFTVFCDGRPNMYWTEMRNATNGCVRNIGSRTGNRFVCLPMGILTGGVTLEARHDVRAQVYDLLTGHALTDFTLTKGSRVSLSQGPGAYLLVGEDTSLGPERAVHSEPGRATRRQ